MTFSQSGQLREHTFYLKDQNVKKGEIASAEEEEGTLMLLSFPPAGYIGSPATARYLEIEEPRKKRTGQHTIVFIIIESSPDQTGSIVDYIAGQ